MEVRALPMVTSATVTSTMPLWGLETASIVPEAARWAAALDLPLPADEVAGRAAVADVVFGQTTCGSPCSGSESS